MQRTTPRHIRAKLATLIILIGLPLTSFAEVIVPSGWSLEPTMNKGVKQFHLVAEAVKNDAGDGNTVDASGYNGGTVGPVIVVTEGESFKVLISNRQRAWTSFGIHGLESAASGSGLPTAQQAPIKRDETWEFSYLASAAGVYRYGPHFEHRSQEQRGMVGAVLVLPKSQQRDQHLVLTIHDLKGQRGSARTLLNGRLAPHIDSGKLSSDKASHIHVLNLSPRPQSLHVPGATLLRQGVGADSHTAPRQGASFSAAVSAGDWWLFFDDPSVKPLKQAGGMPGLPGMPSSSPSGADDFPRISGLALKLKVSGAKTSSQSKARLVSSKTSFGNPQRKPR